MTTPISPGEGIVKNTKLENIKKWTVSTYKCSRQSFYEKLGKTSKTVDPELEDQIETLRDTQRKYSNVLRLAKALSSHFYNMVQTQVGTFYVGLYSCRNCLTFYNLTPQTQFLN